jgi:hypothetical protein
MLKIGLGLLPLLPPKDRSSVCTRAPGVDSRRKSTLGLRIAVGSRFLSVLRR